MPGKYCSHSDGLQNGYPSYTLGLLVALNIRAYYFIIHLCSYFITFITCSTLSSIVPELSTMFTSAFCANFWYRAKR